MKAVMRANGVLSYPPEGQGLMDKELNDQTDRQSGSRFLSAQWRNLIMINYEIDPGLLKDDIPAGTEIDSYDGRTFVSAVGFMFLDTRVLGLPIPMHRDFEEVNLRFYVRRKAPEGWRRGVTFIKEIVPRHAIAAVARILYNEKYVGLPMEHDMVLSQPEGNPARVEYRWRYKGEWNRVGLTAAGQSQSLAPGSLDEFIAEHYWGYTAQRDGTCMEYRVEHPPWNIRTADRCWLECDAAEQYGRRFAEPLLAAPVSAFLADGSPISVFKGVKI
jgi:uncharacterized protein YqjF (DUF2071 family)